jgi:hypothetical protein
MGRIALSFVLLFSGCESDLLITEERPIIESEIPVSQHDDNGEQVSQQVELSGVIDDDQVLSFLTCRLSTQQAGMLWEGNPSPDGSWSWAGQLSPGLHNVRLEVEDVSGNMMVDEWEVFVRYNEAPSCGIESPRPGEYSQYEPVTFQAFAADPDQDQLSLFWSSDQEGTLFEGDAWSLKLQTPGQHQIVFMVEDPFGATCVDQVDITVY